MMSENMRRSLLYKNSLHYWPIEMGWNSGHRGTRAIAVLFSLILVINAATIGVTGTQQPTESALTAEFDDRTQHGTAKALHLAAIETLRSSGRPGRFGDRASTTDRPPWSDRGLHTPSALTGSTDEYEGGSRVATAAVFDNHSRSVSMLAHAVSPDQRANTRIDAATRLLVRADRKAAKRSLRDARQAAASVADDSDAAPVVEQRLDAAEAAFRRAESIRTDGGDGFDRRVVEDRSAAIEAYGTAWRRSQAAITAAVRAEDADVSFSTRADPARTNVTGEISRNVSGTITGVRPDDIESVRITVNDTRTVEANIDRGSGPLNSTSFWKVIDRTTRATTFDVVVFVEPATGGSGGGGGSAGAGEAGADGSDVVEVNVESGATVSVVEAPDEDWIAVRDAPADTTLTADTSDVADGSEVTLRRVDVRTERDVDRFSISVTPPTESLDTRSGPSDARTISYVPMSASVDDDTFDRTRFHLRVTSDALPAQADPEDVTVYRYDGTEWSPVDTTHDGGNQYVAAASTVSTIAVGVQSSASDTDSGSGSGSGSSSAAASDAEAQPSESSGSASESESTAPATGRPDLNSPADPAADDPGILSRIANVVEDIVDSVVRILSPVGTASATAGGTPVEYRTGVGASAPAAVTDERVRQVNASPTPVASATLRVDADGLPDTYERSTTGTDPLDADSNSSRTPRNEAGNGVVDGVEDYDVDGIQTNREGAFSTDPFRNDTDSDGLPDIVELVFDDVSPTDPDTDGDGVGDAAEDVDNDTLTTLQEINAGTDPSRADTDGDGVGDAVESTGPTNATQRDTDGDGLTDAQELNEFPTDPVDPDTDEDGVTDANETFTTTVNASEQGVSVTLTGQGDVASGVSVENRTDGIRSTVVEAARAGPIVELTAERSFDTAELTIEYNASAATNESDLRVFRFNESLRTFVPVNSTLNTSADTVTATLDSFSTYTVFEERTWREYLTAQTEYEPLDAGSTQSLPDAPGTFAQVLSIDPAEYPKISAFATVDTPAGRNGNLDADDFRVFENGTERPISSVRFTEGTRADIVFVFDDTGSMGGEIRGLKNNVRSFTDAVGDAGIDARYALVSFKDNNRVDQRFTPNADLFKRKVDRLRASGGGDGPEDSLDAIATGADLEFRDGAQKVIFHITDARSHNSRRTSATVDDLERTLRQNGTTFFTVSPSGTKTVDLADRVGGTFSNIRSADFDVFLDELQDSLTNRYQIEYESPRPADGTGRRVDVFVTDGATTANATGAYIAPGNGTAPSARDSDGDGLTDQEELAGIKTGSNGIIKTDPYDADTDNDGLDDGEEAGEAFNTSDSSIPEAYRRLAPDQKIYPLDSHPLRVDSDGDGLSDKQEVEGYTVRFAPKETAAVAQAEISTTEDTTVRSVSEVLETRSVSSDPLDRNSDTDELTDAEELAIRTDPTTRDTDGDSIPDGLERSPTTTHDPTLFEQSPPTVIAESVWIETIEDRQGFDQPLDDNDFRFHVSVTIKDVAGVERIRITRGGEDYTRSFSGQQSASFTVTETFEGGNTVGKFVDRLNPVDFSTLSIDAVEDFRNFVGTIEDLAVGDSVFVRAVDVNGFVEEGFRRGAGAVDALVNLFVDFSNKLPVAGDSVSYAAGILIGLANGLRGLLEGIWTLLTTGADLLVGVASTSFDFITKLASDPIGFIAGAITDAIRGATGALNAINALLRVSVDLFDVLAVVADLITGIVNALVGGALSAAASFFQLDAQQFNNPFAPLPGGASNILEYAADDLVTGIKTFTAFVSPAGQVLSDINRNASFAGGFYIGILIFTFLGPQLLARAGSLAANAISSIGPRLANLISRLGNLLNRIPDEISIPRIGAVEVSGDNVAEVVDIQTIITGFISGLVGREVGPGPSIRSTSLAVGSSAIPAARDPQVRDLLDSADDSVVRDLRLLGRDLGGQFAAGQVIPYLSQHSEPGLRLLNDVDRSATETLITDTDVPFRNAIVAAHDDGRINANEAERLLTVRDELIEGTDPESVLSGRVAPGVYYEDVVSSTGANGAAFMTTFRSASAFDDIPSSVSRSDLEQFIVRTDGEPAAAAFVSLLANPATDQDLETFFGYDGPREHLVRARLGNAFVNGDISIARTAATIRALETFSGERLTNATKNLSQAQSPSRVAEVTAYLVDDAGVSPSISADGVAPMASRDAPSDRSTLRPDVADLPHTTDRRPPALGPRLHPGPTPPRRHAGGKLLTDSQ